MKIKLLLEGFVAIILIPFLELERIQSIIVLCFMCLLQVAAFFSYSWQENLKQKMYVIYTISQTVFFIECGTQSNNQFLFILYFSCLQIGSIRIDEKYWSKFIIFLNLYGQLRFCSWKQSDLQILAGGIALMFINMYTYWAFKRDPIKDIENSAAQLSFKKNTEKTALNIVQTPDYRRQQFHSSATSFQQDLTDCFHFFNLIPDSLVLLTVQNLAMHYCNTATMELFKITDKCNFKACLEQLTDVVLTQNKSEMRDPRDSFPSFQSFQQQFQQNKAISSKHSKDEIDINQILADLRSVKPNKRFLQVLKNSQHHTMFIGSYLANWHENTGCSDLEKPPKKRLLEINAHATLVDDKLLILLQIRDVTHRDYIQLVKKSYQAKSNIISFVSHEYRTPLNSVIQFISALQDEKDPLIQNKYIKVALSNCKFLLNLSNDLLDLAQLKAGKFSINPIEIDLKKLIEECLELFKLEANLKKINLKLYYKKSVPSILTNDPNRIRQVLINLLGNAFKYTLKGCIEIRVSNYHNSQVKVEVHDTGLGIKEEFKERLLQAFSKADDQENKKLNPQGVGLGLLISNMIARNLSFNEKGLQFQSEYQNGSSFWFYIAKNIQESDILEDSNDIDEESPERRQSLFRYNNLKIQHSTKCPCANILIVDDNAFNIEVLKFLISKVNPNIKLECSLDAQTAIQMVKLNKCNKCNGYDIIFMDIDMPTMNGMQATQILKKQYPKIQIIGCSAYAKQDEKNLAIQNGMDGYLVKPIQVDQLREYLKTEL